MKRPLASLLLACACALALLATNVAETSLTVPGVSTVIDTGQVKVARYDPSRALGPLFHDVQLAADGKEGLSKLAGWRPEVALVDVHGPYLTIEQRAGQGDVVDVVAGGVGHVIEYAGPAVEGLSMEGRMTVCNMSIEWGAKAGLIAPDQTTFDYVKGRPHAPKGAQWEAAVNWWKTLYSDDDAHWDKVVTLRGEDIAPTVTWGTSPEDALPITATVPDPSDFTGGKVEADDWMTDDYRAAVLKFVEMHANSELMGVLPERAQAHEPAAVRDLDAFPTGLDDEGADLLGLRVARHPGHIAVIVTSEPRGQSGPFVVERFRGHDAHLVNSQTQRVFFYAFS